MNAVQKSPRRALVPIRSRHNYSGNTCAKAPELMNREGWKFVGTADENEVYETDDLWRPAPYYGYPPRLTPAASRLGKEIGQTIHGTHYEKGIDEPCGCKQVEFVTLLSASTIVCGVRRRWQVAPDCPHQHKIREQLVKRVLRP